jgi:uncharacterized membrane protein HdeD (DUF308 family)
MGVVLILVGICLLWIAIGLLATSSGVGFIFLMLGVGCFVNAFKSMFQDKKKR